MDRKEYLKQRREWSREHYRNNKEYYRQRDIKRRNELNIFIRSIKENVGCCFCDEKRGICLDFHHEKYYDKSFNITGSCGKSKKHILEEMKKCIVVCANCHRILHLKEK